MTVDAKWGSNSRATQDYSILPTPPQYYELYYQSLYNYGRFSGEIGGQGMSSAAANAWANQNITAANSYGLAYNVYAPLPTRSEPYIVLNSKLNPNATLGPHGASGGQDFSSIPTTGSTIPIRPACVRV